MKLVFLDASGLIATVNSRDQGHQLAQQIWKSLIDARTPLLTTSLVLIELGDGLARIQHRKLAAQIRERLLAADRVEIVQTTLFQEQQGWLLYQSRADKTWGVTDCISMIVMQEHGIESVFSADRDFEQAGYKLLLTH